MAMAATTAAVGSSSSIEARAEMGGGVVEEARTDAPFVAARRPPPEMPSRLDLVFFPFPIDRERAPRHFQHVGPIVAFVSSSR